MRFLYAAGKSASRFQINCEEAAVWMCRGYSPEWICYWFNENAANSTPTINNATRTMIQVGDLRQVKRRGKLEVGSWAHRGRKMRGRESSIQRSMNRE